MNVLPKKGKMQPGCNLLAMRIVKDYTAYLLSKTTGVELESLVEYHIKKAVDGEPTEEFIKEVMNKVFKILRLRSGSANNNS
jgi:hypothetical protein